MGIQMIIIIVLFAYLGDFLDKKYPAIAPFGLAGLSLFGVFSALFWVIKQAIKTENEE